MIQSANGVEPTGCVKPLRQLTAGAAVGGNPRVMGEFSNVATTQMMPAYTATRALLEAAKRADASEYRWLITEEHAAIRAAD